MKRLLIVEYVTGGGLADSELPGSLLFEARLMLNAVMADLHSLGLFDLKVLCDARLVSGLSWSTDSNPEYLVVTKASGFDAVWKQAIDKVDAVLVIAPETDAILSRLCEDVEKAEKVLLNSSSQVVSVAASKLKTYEILKAARLPVIETKALPGNASWIFPLVVKPDDGVGCDSLVVVEDQQSLDRLIASTNHRNLVVQPWVAGQAASLSVIFSEHSTQLLTYNQQLITVERGCVSLAGCLVGSQTAYFDVYQSILSAIVTCMPGLRGYVGIDVIETQAGPVIVEINPRLTTSYAGLGKAIGVNPAALILQSFYFQTVYSEPARTVPEKPVRIELAQPYV